MDKSCLRVEVPFQLELRFCQVVHAGSGEDADCSGYSKLT